MLVCALFVHIAHETAGAARTRSSLRPLIGEGEELLANLGQIVPREGEGVSIVIPGRAKHEPGIHTPHRGYGFRACAKWRIPE